LGAGSAVEPSHAILEGGVLGADLVWVEGHGYTFRFALLLPQTVPSQSVLP